MLCLFCVALLSFVHLVWSQLGLLFWGFVSMILFVFVFLITLLTCAVFDDSALLCFSVLKGLILKMLCFPGSAWLGFTLLCFAWLDLLPCFALLALAWLCALCIA